MQVFSRRWMKEAQAWVSQPTAANSRHPRPPCVVFVWQKHQSVPEAARVLLRDLQSSCVHPDTHGLVTLAWQENKTFWLQALCYELPMRGWGEDASCNERWPDKKKQLSMLYVLLISLFSLELCILEEWWTAVSAATLPLPSSPPTPLFKTDQLCTEDTNNSSSESQRQRDREGGWLRGTQGLEACSCHMRSEACQLLGPTPAICWCTQRRRQGLWKGRKKTCSSSKNYLPKVQEPVINDFSKTCVPAQLWMPILSLLQARANMERGSTSQTASEHHSSCLNPLPSQARTWAERMQGLETCVP